MRRSFRRFGGLRTSTRKANAPRWQVGNFNLESDVSLIGGPGELDHINIVVPLAQIPLLVPESTNGERYVQRMIKAIDIGGIVWSAGMIPQYHLDRPSELSGTIDLVGEQLLFIDTLAADGSPNSIETRWDLTTPPTTQVALAETEDNDFPVRVLDRWAEYYRMEIDTASVSGVTIVRPDEGRISQQTRYRSKRLRVRIDPKHTLCLCFSGTKGRNFPSDAITRSIKHWARGTIYYRYVW